MSTTTHATASPLDRAAAAGVHRIAVPTPFAVGRVNVWLVEDDPLTLVDAGPNSATSYAELEAALGARGHRVEDLGRIVVTHQHIDHIGLVALLAARSGAEVVALEALAPWMAGYHERMDGDDHYAEEVMAVHGIPRDVRYALRAVSASFRGWGAAATVTRTVRDGDELGFAGRTWKVHHRPGHSPSDTIFLDEATGLLLGGDHLLSAISSNPIVCRPLEGGEPEDRPQTLVGYLESLDRTAALEVDAVLGGHGDPVEGHRALIAERRAMHERRAEKIGRLLKDRPRTAHEVAQELWGNVAVTQAYLTLSEVLGHLDLLLNAGRVVEEIDSHSVSRYRLTR